MISTVIPTYHAALHIGEISRGLRDQNSCNAAGCLTYFTDTR